MSRSLADRNEPDFEVVNCGSIFLVRPLTVLADEWVDANLPSDAQHFGNAVVVEHRCIAPIVEGIKEDGLRVSLTLH